jgi:hypothetical protein
VGFRQNPNVSINTAKPLALPLGFLRLGQGTLKVPGGDFHSGQWVVARDDYL